MQTCFFEKQRYKSHIENPIRRCLNTALFDLDSRLGRNVNLFGIIVIVFTVKLSTQLNLKLYLMPLSAVGGVW